MIDLEIVVAGFVKYKYLRNNSADCLNTGIVYIRMYFFKCVFISIKKNKKKTLFNWNIDILDE